MLSLRSLIVNAVVGLVVLFLANVVGLGVQISLVTLLISAVFGIPGAIVVILLALFDIAFMAAILPAVPVSYWPEGGYAWSGRAFGWKRARLSGTPFSGTDGYSLGKQRRLRRDARRWRADLRTAFGVTREVLQFATGRLSTWIVGDPLLAQYGPSEVVLD